MKKQFTKYITIIILISSLFILGMAWYILGFNAQQYASESMRQKLTQTYQTLKANDHEVTTLKENLKEDYLTRTYAFAYIIEHNPSILQSQSELEKVRDLLQVDELHVIDENGTLFAGTVPKYFGMDFATTKQTAEFMDILKGKKDKLVQEIQPNGAEAKIFQYIGVKRQDKKGIVQIGIAPTRLLEAQKRNEIPYILSRIPLEDGTSIFVMNSNSITIGHTDRANIGMNAKKAGFSFAQARKLQKGGFATINNTRKYVITMNYQDMCLGISMKTSAIYADRNTQMLIIGMCLCVITFVTIAVINRFLQNHIITGIEHLKADISKITNGQLDTRVEVCSSPEFMEISQGINKMVQSILNTTVRMSKIIDVINMQIGVFEIPFHSSHIYISSQLASLMGWSEEETAYYISHKESFLEQIAMLQQCQKNDGAYLMGQDPVRWLQLYMNQDEESIFGIIQDVTKEMAQKSFIRYQRDHDQLTGLRTMRLFKNDVQAILENPKGYMAMVMLDLDHFKQINDTYGHAFGDIYLCHLAAHMQETDPQHFITARRSGDEFCMFLYSFTTRDELRQAMQDFYASLYQDSLRAPDDSIHITHISSGLAWYAKEDIDTWIQQADKALYMSKRGSRGTLSEYTP